MVWPILAAAAVSAGASIFGANKAASSANKAAKKQAQAAALAREDLRPYREAGTNALASYMDAIGLNGPDAQRAYFDNFQDDPYLEGILGAGVRSIENSAAARGTLYGGNTLSAISDYSGQLRKGAYDTRLGQIGGMVDTGRAAAAGAGAAAQQGAANQGNYLTQGGNLAGAGIINAGNALAGGLNNYQAYQMYQQGLLGGMNPGGTVNNTWRAF